MRKVRTQLAAPRKAWEQAGEVEVGAGKRENCGQQIGVEGGLPIGLGFAAPALLAEIVGIFDVGKGVDHRSIEEGTALDMTDIDQACAQRQQADKNNDPKSMSAY